MEINKLSFEDKNSSSYKNLFSRGLVFIQGNLLVPAYDYKNKINALVNKINHVNKETIIKELQLLERMEFVVPDYDDVKHVKTDDEIEEVNVNTRIVRNCILCYRPIRSYTKNKDWNTRNMHRKCYKSTF